MTMEYIPSTAAEEAAMLAAMGAASFEHLLEIPQTLRLQRPLNLPPPLSQMELHRALLELAQYNDAHGLSFLGGGSYDHFIPSVVGHILSRSEFSTAYTPYQAEMSQGVLQTIYEYQSMTCALTGMDVANASLYDGASALAEAALMALRITKRREILIARTVHPHYREVVATYLSGLPSIRLKEIPLEKGRCSFEHLESSVNEHTAAVLIQNPNFFGQLEEMEAISNCVHAKGALLVMSVDPISLGVIKTPGEYQSDIAVGEGQSLGNPTSFGGPYVGFFATRREFIRQMPGRIVGRTTDTQGRPGFCLTLQTREQHIRRERATSNICTNQALCALASTLYMASLGREGFREVSMRCLVNAHTAMKELMEIPGIASPWVSPFFKEFVIRLPFVATRLVKRLSRLGIFAGIPLGTYYRELSDHILICVTEKHSAEDIARLTQAVAAMLRSR